MSTQTYVVQGMDCTSCAAKVEKGVCKLDGVAEVRIDFATAQMRVEGDASYDTIRERVELLGYSLLDESARRQPAEPMPGGVIGFVRYLFRRHETRFALAGGAIILFTLLLSLLPIALPDALRDGLLAIAMIVAVLPIARDGLVNLFINRDFNINLLMTIAAAGALIIGETLEAATVIFFFAVGEALEGFTADRARDSLRSLVSLAPAQALRLTDEGHEQTMPVAALRVDDVILVKPGERIPMDGVVIDGTSDVNQSPITGESIPVHKSSGADVFAGTVNGSGLLKIRVTRLAADNTLSRIITLVEEAQSVRAPSQRMIDQFARVYTPGVVVLAALVAVVPPLLFGQPFLNPADGSHGWLYRALAMLVIACPCALVISGPVTIISAITAAARRGVLIKGGAHLEALGGVRAFAFDKTGTLTRGVPVVTTCRAIDCPNDEDCAACNDVLALASAVERRSTHPLAKAITSAAHLRGLDTVYAPAEGVEALPGSGVRGLVNGKMVTVGNHGLFDAEHPHHREFCAKVDDAEAHGQTTMLLCDGDRVRGFIAAADEVRQDSADVVAALKSLGAQTVMLTGDNETVAQSIGRAVGVDDVRAGLLPADKVAAVRKLAEQYGAVAMIGDGVNDTPALAAATVGIAMGGAGSAQAIETADIALMADDLKQLPFAVRLSRLARGIIRQNIVFSLGIKLLFVVLAIEGSASMWAAVVADMGVSLLVTLNGMRPLRG